MELLWSIEHIIWFGKTLNIYLSGKFEQLPITNKHWRGGGWKPWYVIALHIKADEQRTPLPTGILYLSLVPQEYCIWALSHKLCRVRSGFDDISPRKPWLLPRMVLTTPAHALSSESALGSFSGPRMLRCAELLSLSGVWKKSLPCTTAAH